MAVYYNEWDKNAAEWLRNLIKEGLIADGEVDTRSICDVQAADLVGFTQHHFFAGIGGWPLAMRLAGVHDDRPIWSMSCPCPPFSCAGKKQRCPKCGGRPLPCPRRTGFFVCMSCENAWLADARHLWPECWRLISEFRPAEVVGEQVGGADGMLWLAGVRASLEILGYSLGATDWPAASVGQKAWVEIEDEDQNVVWSGERVVGPPHMRQRIYWGAARLEHSVSLGLGGERIPERRTPEVATTSGDGLPAGLADSVGQRHDGREDPTSTPEPRGHRKTEAGGEHLLPSGLANTDCARSLSRWQASEADRHRDSAIADGGIVGLANTNGTLVSGQPCAGQQPEHESDSSPDQSRADGVSVRMGSPQRDRLRGSRRTTADQSEQSGDWKIFNWSDFRVLQCRDGESRRIGREIEPLAYGIPSRKTDSRMGFLLSRLAELGHSPESASRILREARGNRTGRLKGYGNAIVPQLGAAFIQEFLSAVQQNAPSI